MMRAVFVLACLATVAIAQRPFGPNGPVGNGPRGPGPRGPGPKCADGSRPNCQFNPGSRPSCTCADGSSPSLKPPCDDGSFPQCPGACQDGSDAILTGQPFVNPPCADNSFPDLSKCACADGTALPARPPRRG